MLEPRFKVALWLSVLLFTSLPIIGILKSAPQADRPIPKRSNERPPEASREEPLVPEEMVLIPAGDFIHGTQRGGYDEQPERKIYLDAFFIDRYEATIYHYQAFVSATGHRKPGPPSRYAKTLARLRGPNQPIVYVSWDDVERYCQGKGKRLPTEAEWEKAMRGVDGRLYPWGDELDPIATNWAQGHDGFDGTAAVGKFLRDVSIFGVADGAGNVMEWVADWYDEQAYRDAPDRNPKGPDHGLYKVLRGGGYTSVGIDLRITSRCRMVPDFRDETIGFRCARSYAEIPDTARAEFGWPIRENRSNRG